MAGRIVEDTRQQDGKHAHVRRWMEAHGVEFAPRASALPFGDYMRDGSNVCVDTKRGVHELAMDVGRDHARFARELDRAIAAGYRIVILVECSGAEARYADRGLLPEWPKGVRHYGRMTGARLASTIGSMERNRDGMARFEFCRRAEAPRRICELLGIDYSKGEP